MVRADYSITDGFVACTIAAIHSAVGSGSRFRFHEPCHSLFKIGAIERFGEVTVHAGAQAGMLAVFTCIGGQRKNRHR